MTNFQPNDIIVPDALDYPEGALRVDSWGGTTLVAYPEGGGPKYTFDLDALKKYDFYVVDIEMTTPRWRKAMFYLCDGPSFVGYHCGHRWNGWACPMFPIESVRAIAEWMNAQGFGSSIDINETTGTVTIIEEDEECNEAEEPETRARNGIPTMALYGVGAYGWTWTEDELNSEEE